MKPDEAVAERIHAAEKDVATVRLGVIALNSFVYFVLFNKAHTIAWLAIGALAMAWVYALTVHFLKPYRRHAIMQSGYFTSLTDALLITAWLHATGGFDSPFYVLWYVSIAAVAYRWNGRDTMTTATLYAACYLVLVAADGQTAGHWADLILRVGYIFLVAALGVLLSGEVIDQIRSKVELRKSATRAELAEAKVRGLLESAPDSIVTADRNGRIVIFNAEAERAFGYSRDEILNQPIEILIPPAFARTTQRRLGPVRAAPGRSTDWRAP